jgi:hypothetical protein
MDPITIGLILSAAGLAQNAFTTNKQNVQTPGAASGGQSGLGGGPFSTGMPTTPPTPNIPTISQPTGVGEILSGTVGFDPSRPEPGTPGAATAAKSSEGTTLDTSKDKLPTTNNPSSANITASDWNDILKSASLALQNPAIAAMLGFAPKDHRQSAAPPTGGGANPQLLIGNGMQRANVGALLTQIPRG